MALAEEFNDVSDEWFGLEPGTFPAVPRAETGGTIAVRSLLKIPVSDTGGFRAHADVVEGALLILSQSPTARKLAETAIAAGYTIVIDPPVIHSGETGSGNEVLGSTDSLNKRLKLKSGDDPLQLAIVIAHELAHASQFEKGGLAQSVTPFHPLSAIKQLMAMEGDARAHEFAVALELSYKQKGDPDERLVFPQAMDVAADNIGGAMPKKVIEHFRPQFPDVDAGQMMARIFKSFYNSADLREHYELSVLHSMETVEAAHPGAYKIGQLFSKELTSAELLEKLDSHTTPYLQKRAEFIDLDSPAMSAIAQGTQDRLAALEKIRHENPATLGEKAWQAPVYQFVPQQPSAPAAKAAPRP